MSEEIEAVIFLEGTLADLQRLAERLARGGVDAEVLKPETGGRG